MRDVFSVRPAPHYLGNVDGVVHGEACDAAERVGVVCDTHEELRASVARPVGGAAVELDEGGVRSRDRLQVPLDGAQVVVDVVVGFVHL